MTHIFIDAEVVRAIGLSIGFMGVMVSIITVGISFLIYRLSKQKGREYLKMAGLITAWAVFIALHVQVSISPDYNPIWMVYSLQHLISIFVGATTIIAFLIMLPKFWKKNIFNKNLLIIAGIFAVLGLLMRGIFPFFANYYLSLLQRIVIIIPPLIGFFMIIKSYIGDRRK